MEVPVPEVHFRCTTGYPAHWVPNMKIIGSGTSIVIQICTQGQVTFPDLGCFPHFSRCPGPSPLVENSKRPMRRQRFRTRLFLLHTLIRCSVLLQGSNRVSAGQQQGLTAHAGNVRKKKGTLLRQSTSRPTGFTKNSRPSRLRCRRRAARQPLFSISCSYITTAASRRRHLCP